MYTLYTVQACTYKTLELNNNNNVCVYYTYFHHNFVLLFVNQNTISIKYNTTATIMDPQALLFTEDNNHCFDLTIMLSRHLKIRRMVNMHDWSLTWVRIEFRVIMKSYKIHLKEKGNTTLRLGKKSISKRPLGPSRRQKTNPPAILVECSRSHQSDPPLISIFTRSYGISYEVFPVVSSLSDHFLILFVAIYIYIYICQACPAHFSLLFLVVSNTIG